jgi:adenylate cyclase
MSDIFISYARSTAAQAQAVAEALRGLGYGVWRDDELPAHRDYSEVIEERLRAAKAVVVVWSAEAVKSQWVRAEADLAREAGTLVQLSLDGAALPMPFNRIQCADMTGWGGDLAAPGWKKVVASVADLVGQIAPSVTTAATRRPRKHSICVLPFANISDDPQQEYFSDGITEDIITDLSKVSALSVVARNTAFGFKGKSPNVKEVAHQLGVSHVLEGSVRKAGGRVRITAQLIDGLAGDHVWAERYDRDLTDIFALQDEISQAIVAALKLKLLPEEKAAIERRGTDSAEAYTIYLMARQLYVSGPESHAPRASAIVRLCTRATEIDPGYALAWALMAQAQMILRQALGKGGDDGLAAAERALILDSKLPEAHAVKARILADSGRHDEAAAEIDLALAQDAESYEVIRSAAYLSYKQQRLEDAIRYWEKASNLMEADINSSSMLMSCYVAVGNREAARRSAKISLSRAEKAVALDPSNGAAMAYSALALATLGEAERAKERMNRALLIDPDDWNVRYNFACVLLIHLDEPDAALNVLGPVLESVGARFFLGHIKVDPDFIRLRDDPRFRAMIAAAEARLAAAKPADEAGA